MVLAKVKGTIKKHGMVNPGEKVLVAVSGGPDSVCLLSALQALASDLDITLHIAHLDHQFRGKESAEEALFVRDLANRLRIPATIEQIDVPAYCRMRGLSAQAGAREVRYAFFARVAQTVGAARIATGHTATDQAETFLMRLVRGAGISGLSAIPPVRDTIIRPLLDVTREEVLEFLRNAGTTFTTDPSNAKSLYTRNRIRLEVLPVLKDLNPRIVETLATEAALLRDEDEAVEAHLAAIADDAFVQHDDTLSVKRDVFDTQPPAYRRRLLKKLVDLAGADSSLLSFGRINDALSFMLTTQTGRTMHLTHGLSITREYNRFLFSADATPVRFSHALILPGTATITELGLEIETRIRDWVQEEDSSETENYRWQALFDYDKIGSYLTVRNRLSGDWFCPAGMQGKSKKLQDYFVDEKIPRRKRDSIPVLCAADTIVWVIGCRTDERFLPGQDTKNVLVVQVRNSA